MKIYSKANSRWLCSGIQSTWWKWRFLQWRVNKHTHCDNFTTDDLMNFPSFFTQHQFFSLFLLVYIFVGAFSMLFCSSHSFCMHEGVLFLFFSFPFYFIYFQYAFIANTEIWNLHQVFFLQYCSLSALYFDLFFSSVCDDALGANQQKLDS